MHVGISGLLGAMDMIMDTIMVYTHPWGLAAGRPRHAPLSWTWQLPGNIQWLSGGQERPRPADAGIGYG